MKLKTPELELLVAEFFNVRTKLIIPNVYWGFNMNYEADLVVVTKSRYAYEVELKVSKSDLKKDQSKRNCHNDKRFKRLYFAMPENIYDESLVPETAGVLLACYVETHTNWHGRKYEGYWVIVEKRKPKDQKVKPLSEKEYLKLLHLLAMRVWTMKKKFVKLLKKQL